MIAATWIAILTALYALAGVIVAVLFVIRGVNAVDDAARESGWSFRLLIIPGCAALWPLIMIRWIQAEPPGSEGGAP